jgi:deoxycytidylate deaminase
MSAIPNSAANDASNNGDLFDKNDLKQVIDSTHTQELVIALCGPIGSPMHPVADQICSMLQQTFAYEKCEVIKLSRFIDSHLEKSSVHRHEVEPKEADRLNRLIDCGNAMRKQFGASVLAELAVNHIRLDREQNGKSVVNDSERARYIPRRVCHIIDSIKNQEELNLLRTVYREVLFVVGVFAPVSSREKNLKNKAMSAGEISKLMDRDSGEELAEGQTVSKTFPQCDFFLRMESENKAQLKTRVERFLHLILGTKIITPTRAETAMYAAASAAGNSACLSRQVGAAVTDAAGEVLATGWNDVPRPFGGLYFTDSELDPTGEKDRRCWNIGKCFNDEEKELLADEIVQTLEGFISKEQRKEAKLAVMADKRLKGLIEFSRSIHAEMHAILTALKSCGERVSGGKIFVTTYPCHSCARHIVASGIREVYYIEPYKKSLATKLHEDSVSEAEADVHKVRVLPYDGVAPNKYLSLFKMAQDSRKKNGKVIEIAPNLGVPRLEKSLEALPELEALVVKSLVGKNLLLN